MPASAASFRKIASAVGERQMFPVQTNKTPNLLPDIARPNIESALLSGACTGETHFGILSRRAVCAWAGGRPHSGLAQQAYSRDHPVRRGKRFGSHIQDDIPRSRNEPRPA